jgi:hypothetical protein
VHRPAHADRARHRQVGVAWLRQELVHAAVRALHLEVQPAVAGKDEIDRVDLQLAGERVDALVDVRVDDLAVGRQDRLLVEGDDGVAGAGSGRDCCPDKHHDGIANRSPRARVQGCTLCVALAGGVVKQRRHSLTFAQAHSSPSDMRRAYELVPSTDF